MQALIKNDLHSEANLSRHFSSLVILLKSLVDFPVGVNGGYWSLFWRLYTILYGQTLF